MEAVIEPSLLNSALTDPEGDEDLGGIGTEWKIGDRRGRKGMKQRT